MEWETDRLQFIGRGRTLASPAALDGRALSGTTGMVLDPVVSLRQRIRLVPGASARLTFSTGTAVNRETAEALAQKYRDPSAPSRAFSLAFTHAQSDLRHLDISSDDALLFERLASRVLFDDGALRASAGDPHREHAGAERALAAQHLGRSADPARACVHRGRRRARATDAAGAGVLAAQGPERGPRGHQRASDRLHGRDAGAARRRPRHRTVARLAASARWRVPAASRHDVGGRTHAHAGRRAGHPDQRPRRPPRASRSAAKASAVPEAGPSR